MPTMLEPRTLTFDHLELGSTAPPGDGVTSGGWQRKLPDTTRVVPSRTRPGRKACRIAHVAGTDPINSSGERCEFTDFRRGGREYPGSEAWYATAVYLDPAFTPPGSYARFLQIHHDGGGSPPLAFAADRVWDPDRDAAGALYIAGRDTALGRERAWNLTPDTPIGVPIRLIFHVVWGGEPGTTNPGRCECWSAIGNVDATRADSWVQEHPDGGWPDTTFFGGDEPYWKGGWYSSATQPAVLEHDGMIRRRSMRECIDWFTPPVAPPPGTDPAPDPAMEAIARDLAASAQTLATSTSAAIEAALRDVKAAALIAQGSAQALRQ